MQDERKSNGETDRETGDESNGDHKRKSKMTVKMAEALYADFVETHGDGLSHYILKDGLVVLEPNFFKWSMFLEEGNRKIDKTVIREGRPRREPGSFFHQPWPWQQRDRHRFQEPFYNQEIIVSTVFIGTSLDELFESMVFGGILADSQYRYNTLGEAKQGHHVLVVRARAAAGWCARRGQGRRAKKWLARRERSIKLLRKRHYQCSAESLDSLGRHELRVLRTPAGAQVHLTLMDYLNFANQQGLAHTVASRFFKAS